MPFQHLTSVQQESATAAADTAVVASIDAPPTGGRSYLYSITWSYSDTPTGGRLTTASGLAGDEVDITITQSGDGFLPFPPLPFEYNSGLTVTLAAGGGGVVGKLVVCYAVFPL